MEKDTFFNEENINIKDKDIDFLMNSNSKKIDNSDEEREGEIESFSKEKIVIEEDKDNNEKIRIDEEKENTEEVKKLLELEKDLYSEEISKTIHKSYKVKKIVEEEDEDQYRKYLMEKFNIDEEVILIMAEKYKEIKKEIGPIDIDNIEEETIRQWAKEAKKNKMQQTQEKIANSIANSILERIEEAPFLEEITYSSVFIQKEQSAFFLNVIDKINKWDKIITKEPDSIIKDEYINYLFNKKYIYKVFNPDISKIEMFLVGEDSFLNFIDIVSVFLLEEQKIAVEKIKDFIEENGIKENLLLEKVFRL